MPLNRIAIASDHAGYKLKKILKEQLAESGAEVLDLGTDNEESVDYPVYARSVADALMSRKVERGILICGTGIGMSIAANRYKTIRAALCHDIFTAKMSRRHNNANVLVMGANVLDTELAKEIMKRWLEEPFDGGRHERRVNLIENCNENISE